MRRARDAIIRNARPLQQASIEDFDLSRREIIYSGVPSESDMRTVERVARQVNKSDIPRLNRSRAKLGERKLHRIRRLVFKNGDDVVREVVIDD